MYIYTIVLKQGSCGERGAGEVQGINALTTLVATNNRATLYLVHSISSTPSPPSPFSLLTSQAAAESEAEAHTAAQAGTLAKAAADRSSTSIG